jgi:hypothetical protein
MQFGASFFYLLQFDYYSFTSVKSNGYVYEPS